MADKKSFMKKLINETLEIEENHFYMYNTIRKMAFACKEAIPRILDDVGGQLENLEFITSWPYAPFEELDEYMQGYGVPVTSFTKGKYSHVIWMHYADFKNENFDPNFYCVRSVPGSGKVEIINPVTKKWDVFPDWGKEFKIKSHNNPMIF